MGHARDIRLNPSARSWLVHDGSSLSVIVRSDLQLTQPRFANSLENFKYVFDKALEGKFIDRMDQNQEIFARYMNDPAFAKVVAEFLRKQVHEQIRAEAKQESVQPG